jgi:pyruvate kinase
MHIRTKIICTIGPAVNNYEKIVQLIEAGMNVARINFSHGIYEEHAKTIALLKQARETLKCPLAIMLDTKGPEIRIRNIQGGQIALEKDQELKLFKENKEGNKEGVSITPSHILDEVQEGMELLFDDGYISAKVIKKYPDAVGIKIENAGILKSGKKINIPHEEIYLPSMTPEDIEDLAFGCQQEVDMVAASFIRNADNVLDIRKLLKRCGQKEIMIISKIESVQGVKNFESILQVSDGIMVARGDLGVELPLNQVPKLQKMMIRRCNIEGKVVVTATQMLESMISYPRPTRAEVSDVANAIYDSTSCIMLSGETAVGKYPIEATKMMRSVAEKAEEDFDYVNYDLTYNNRNYKNLSSAIGIATVKTAYSLQAEAIFTYTSSGFTSKVISRFRPKTPIISLTNSKKTYHQLASVWGVVPVLREYANADEAFDAGMCYALQEGYVHYGDRVIVTAGTPFGIRGTTNMMIIKSIGEVIVRGEPGQGEVVYGQALFMLVSEKTYDTQGKIIVLTHCESKYEPLIKQAAGMILQNFEDDTESERAALEIAKKHHIPVITRAESACSLIKEGEFITLSPSKGIVFRGKLSNDAEIMKDVCGGLNTCRQKS